MTTVKASAVIGRPVQAVWPHVGDFKAQFRWMDATASVAMLQGDGRAVGDVRRVVLDNQIVVDEVIITLDETEHVLRYRLLSEFPDVKNVIGTFRLTPVTNDDTTFIERHLTFDSPSTDRALAQIIEDRFQRMNHSLRLLAGLVLDTAQPKVTF